jgi:hypothetical protein
MFSSSLHPATSSVRSIRDLPRRPNGQNMNGETMSGALSRGRSGERRITLQKMTLTGTGPHPRFPQQREPAAHHDPEDDAFCDKGDRRAWMAMSACITTTEAHLKHQGRQGILRPSQRRTFCTSAFGVTGMARSR